MSKSEHIATPVETLQHRLASTLAAADKVSVKQLTMSTDDLKLLLDLSRGYAAGIRDAADLSLKLPCPPRTSAAILELLDKKGASTPAPAWAPWSH